MSIPLCVDLDGTLIKTDSLYESFLLLLKKHPFYLLLALLWLFKGLAYFKSEIAKRITLDVTTLPYSKELLDFLKAEYAKGRKLILVTAADKYIANAVARHLGIFAEVFASDGRLNLKGTNKKNLLHEIAGQKKFDYAGNDKNDLKVWASSRQAIVVNANARLVRKAQTITNIEKIFPREKHTITSFLKAIRVHQYVKNILIFIPLLTGHLFFHLPSIINASLAFIAFCLLASSAYLINDLIDLESDRHHRTKHQRPFAAGDLSIALGISIIICFIGLSVFIALFLDRHFLLLLITYFFITFIYSLYLKKKLLIDVFTLAILYALRVIAGTAAIDVAYSEWLITFSLFFFLSLAFVKRYTELYFLAKDNKISRPKGRDYHINDLVLLSIFGVVSGYVSTLVFAFYISSTTVASLYQHPAWLWLVCLILLYWISRIWMLATRGNIQEDPVAFALHDRTSLLVVLIISFVMLMACL